MGEIAARALVVRESNFVCCGVSDLSRSRLLLACEGSRWICRDVPDQGRGGSQWGRRRRHRQVGIGLGMPRPKAARDRRLRLDPDQLAREQRIEEAAVDVELAGEARAEAEQAVAAAQVAAAAAVERLLAERLSVKGAVQLTGGSTSRRCGGCVSSRPPPPTTAPLLRASLRWWRDAALDAGDQPARGGQGGVRRWFQR